MASVMAALNWAAFMEWLPAVPKIRKVKCSKLKAMKGRPISQVEFDKLLAATPGEVGEAVADSWEHVLRGLWESALRLDELLHVSWDDPTAIMPDWSGTYPVLTIPADLQKNDTEEAIPLLPGFEALLLETPEHERTGWVFHPARLRQRKDHQRRRLDGEWVGKVISRIGESAGVVVEAGKGSKPPKYASAHDLRRSCADRLIDQGVPEREVQRVLRHASGETTRRHYAPGTVQRSAGIIRKAAGVPRYNLVG
jgi:integrase